MNEIYSTKITSCLRLHLWTRFSCKKSVIIQEPLKSWRDTILKAEIMCEGARWDSSPARPIPTSEATKTTHQDLQRVHVPSDRQRLNVLNLKSRRKYMERRSGWVKNSRYLPWWWPEAMHSMKVATNDHTRPHPVKTIGREGVTGVEKFKTMIYLQQRGFTVGQPPNYWSTDLRLIYGRANGMPSSPQSVIVCDILCTGKILILCCKCCWFGSTCSAPLKIIKFHLQRSHKQSKRWCVRMLTIKWGCLAHNW